MAGDQSFDVVSDFDPQELRNTLDQVRREVGTRFDFKGVPVELTLVKEEGLTPHNFVLQGAGVSIERELATQPLKLSFTPAVAGRSAFYCSNKLPFVKSHRERGMEGVLEVVD